MTKIKVWVTTDGDYNVYSEDTLEDGIQEYIQYHFPFDLETFEDWLDDSRYSASEVFHMSKRERDALFEEYQNARKKAEKELRMDFLEDLVESEVKIDIEI